MSDEDTRLKEYEKREAALKEKLKEEHAQLLNFQKKLTQAGSHLKTLAQENTTLKKTLTETKTKQDELSSRVQELETSLKETKQGHQKEIKQLVDILEESTAPEEKTIPDVSTSTLLDSYIKSVQKRLNKPKKEQQETLKATIERLNKEIQELKKAHPIEAIENSLRDVLQDPENGNMDSSAPPSILLLLERLRSILQEQKSTIDNANKASQSLVEDTTKDLKRHITQLNMTINNLTEEKEQAISEKENIELQIAIVDTLQDKINQLETKLTETEKEKAKSQEREKQLSQEHQSLLGKLSHIKETLVPRLEQDKQLRQRVAELTEELESVTRELEQCRSNMMVRDEETSIQFEKKDAVIAQLSQKLEQVHQEREEYEQLSMQLDAQCNQLHEELDQKTTQLEQLKAKMEADRMEYESQKASLSNLQTVLEEFQATKDVEMQTAVEHIERQLQVAKKSWAEYEERAHLAEAALEKLQKDIGKTQQYEKEIKEKNLLIGKLRHEAIILNEHLVEAMRKLKEETSESNVDRQLISNLLIGFLMAPRGDRKRYDILTIMSNVLQLSEEQKEQIGLVRPKNSTHLQPGSPTTEHPPKESFTDAWISFLLKESSPLRRNRSAVSLPSSENIEL